MGNKVDIRKAGTANTAKNVGAGKDSELATYIVEKKATHYDCQVSASSVIITVDNYIFHEGISKLYYRYRFAQAMNTLKKDYITNKKQLETEKPYRVSHTHWAAFPDFK